MQLDCLASFPFCVFRLEVFDGYWWSKKLQTQDVVYTLAIRYKHLVLFALVTSEKHLLQTKLRPRLSFATSNCEYKGELN